MNNYNCDVNNSYCSRGKLNDKRQRRLEGKVTEEAHRAKQFLAKQKWKILFLILLNTAVPILLKWEKKHCIFNIRFLEECLPSMLSTMNFCPLYYNSQQTIKKTKEDKKQRETRELDRNARIFFFWFFHFLLWVVEQQSMVQKPLDLASSRLNSVCVLIVSIA